MRRLEDKTRALIMADWHVGKSQNFLAKKYKLSPATINKMCKGVERKNIDAVELLVKTKQELAEQTEQEVNAIQLEVNERTKNIQFFNNCALRNVDAAMAIECSGQLDFKHRADTILKGKETVLGKTPDVAVQINNYKSLDDIPTGDLIEMAGSK